MYSNYLPWKVMSRGSSKDPFRLIGHFSPQQFANKDRDYTWIFYHILDPSGQVLSVWNRVFLAFCLAALFVDPLYFYLPQIVDRCITVDRDLFLYVVYLRTWADFFYLIHILLKFRTAYVLPGSRAIARGELVMDPKQIAIHYLKTDFIIDFAAMLPLPQIMNWFIIPKLRKDRTLHTDNALSMIVLIQYVPRLFLIFPLNRRIIKNTGVVTKTAWAGAAYNVLLYMLASHVLGASWYILSVQRQHACWREQCEKQTHNELLCNFNFPFCHHHPPSLNITSVLLNCDAKNDDAEFDFGIFANALTTKAYSKRFVAKYLYCLWWGLKNLSSYGQDLETSGYSPETLFCILICIGGLVLFCQLIGNIQTYLQSMTVRLEEWRVRKRDTEEWMRHRQLPEELQERVRRFVQYKWLATRGVDEDAILNSLPLDLRREIQQHLCLALVRRVPFFSQMDSLLLDAICERLISSLSTDGTYIVREGDPVDEMLFVIRGQLESSTTNGGRTGFFNSIVLRPGDFCGEELLTWALMPDTNQNLPSSTRTVRAIGEVEAFALRANDLKYVANQFKLLHSKKLQHVFRYYSHQWRTWGACLLQAAWRRFKKRKMALELGRQESYYYYGDPDEAMEGEYYEEEDTVAESSGAEGTSDGQHLGVTVLASKFAANTRRGVHKKVKPIDPGNDSSLEMPKLLKPSDPDFSSGSGM